MNLHNLDESGCNYFPYELYLVVVHEIFEIETRRNIIFDIIYWIVPQALSAQYRKSVD